MVYVLIIALVLLAALGGHYLLALMGAAVAVSAGLWAVIIGSIIIFCVAIPLFFLFSGLGVLLVVLFAFIWALVAIIAFPILLPILLPLFIILVFVSIMRKRIRTSADESKHCQEEALTQAKKTCCDHEKVKS